MQYVSATDAKQKWRRLLDAAQREPVVIRMKKRDIAVILSTQEYDRLRVLNVAELQRLCDRVTKKAAKGGLTEEKLQSLLAMAKDRVSGQAFSERLARLKCSSRAGATIVTPSKYIRHKK